MYVSLFEQYIDDPTEVDVHICVYIGSTDTRKRVIVSDGFAKDRSRRCGSGLYDCTQGAKHCALLLCFCWRQLQLARITFTMPSCCEVGCTTTSEKSKLFLVPTSQRERGMWSDGKSGSAELPGSVLSRHQTRDSMRQIVCLYMPSLSHVRMRFG